MKHRTTTSGRAASAFAGAFLSVLVAVSAADAQLVGNPAGPRRGAVYELSLSPPDPTVLARLNELGFNIGHVTPDAASIFATPGEYDYLVSNGYPVTVVGSQPSAPRYERGVPRGVLGVYHSYADVTTMLQTFASSYPSLTQLISLGQSVQGRALWALQISDNPLVDENEPEFKYVSTMHGDEPVGTEMCLYFIDHLLSNYGIDSNITSLVNGTAIWIVPLMNPDGLENGSRFNANGFDLNRSFPDYPSEYSGTIWNTWPAYVGLEPEVQHLIQWSAGHSFVLSANFHTGAVVASYPYDADPPLPTFVVAATPDHTLFLALATAYASNNPPMSGNDSGAFDNGIVNGNDWYLVSGGMQDWMYRYLGDDEITVELSVPKRPSQSLLPDYWDDNRDSMMAYLAWVHRGVRGTVTDAATNDPVFAVVRPIGNAQPVFTDPDIGDYSRLLPPGTYDLLFTALFYDPVLVENVVVTSGAATLIDVQMNRSTNLSGGGLGTVAVLAALIALTGTGFLRRSHRFRQN